MAWAIGDEEPQLWRAGDPFPEQLRAVLPDAELRAWNCNFERVIWERHCVPRLGWPEVRLEQWADTMAEALAMALPANLGHCAQVLGVTEQKDEPGHALMLRMSRPRKLTKNKIIWWDEADKLDQLYGYCLQDVKTERAISKAVRRLSSHERRLWLLDQTINDRGMLVDVPLVRAARIIAKAGLDEANEAVRDATGGAVEKITKVADLTKWLRDTEGLDIDNVQKSTVRELLESDGLSDPARRALEARADAGRSSVAKLESMLRAKGDDNRIRGMLFYHGAATGRWSSRGVQVHNFPRGDIGNPEQYIELVLAKDYAALDEQHPPLAIISSLLRGMLRASDGHVFNVGDFAQIEARVLNWLAGQHDVVALFAKGEPVYERMAALIYGCDPYEILNPSQERQLGKATELGCGYGMGADKFITASKQVYGIDVALPPEGAPAEIAALGEGFPQYVVDTYRRAHPAVVQLWSDLGRAAMRAVQQPGEIQVVRGCKFVVRGAYLWLMLPSRRPLAYAKPKIVERRTPWGEMRPSVQTWGINSQTRKWQARALYGGLLAENIVQALSRDVMADAMLRVEEAGYPNVLTVHDEIITEPPIGHGSLEEFLKLMTQPPEWATGCPIAVEGWEGRRYRK